MPPILVLQDSCWKDQILECVSQMEIGRIQNQSVEVTSYTTNYIKSHSSFKLLKCTYSLAELADCGPLPNPFNGTVFVNGTVEGSSAFYSCDFGFILEGISFRFCQSNGSWSDVEPVCERKYTRHDRLTIRCMANFLIHSCLLSCCTNEI